MLNIELTFENAETRALCLPTPLLIGRGADCALRIANWRVSKKHARLLQETEGVVLEDLGTLGGTLVNGRRIIQCVTLAPDDEVLIGPCRLRVSQTACAGQTQDVASPSALNSADAGLNLNALAHTVNGQYLPERRRWHSALISALNLRRHEVMGMSDVTLRAETESLLTQIVAQDETLPADADRTLLCREVLNEAVGLGPLEALLADPEISEIMVNRYDEIYVERAGRLSRYHLTFSSEQSVRWVVDRIVSPLGRRIDESSPMVDARLPDGSRVHAIISPVALKGTSLTIRKFLSHRPSMDDLIRYGSLSVAMAAFLALCIRTRKNVLVAGGTGSGKTTLLNILSHEIDESERVVTIEDAAELRLEHENLVSLEARPANQEGRGQIDIRELVRNALRMRPDRIIVGECRGSEAFDMLTAMNSGHEGSMSTVHANSPRDALGRLELMTLMSGVDVPLSSIREHIAASIDVIVQQTRLSNGQRVVSAIVEVAGMESGRIQLLELFRFDRMAGFEPCGVVPELARQWSEAGVVYQADWFFQRHGQDDRAIQDRGRA